MLTHHIASISSYNYITIREYFTRLCAKVVALQKYMLYIILLLRQYVRRSWTLKRCLLYAFLLFETICLLENCIPPSFFDLTEHMLIHLVDNLENCGLVGGRWLYPLERHMREASM